MYKLRIDPAYKSQALNVLTNSNQLMHTPVAFKNTNLIIVTSHDLDTAVKLLERHTIRYYIAKA